MFPLLYGIFKTQEKQNICFNNSGCIVALIKQVKARTQKKKLRKILLLCRFCQATSSFHPSSVFFSLVHVTIPHVLLTKKNKDYAP